MINSKSKLAYYLKSILASFSLHKNTTDNICILSNRRSGSTLLTELIATNPNIRFVDQPMEVWAFNPYRNYLPNVSYGQYISLSQSDLNKLKKYMEDIVFRNKLKGYTQWNIFTKSYHFKTNRTVVKLLNCLPLINWFHNNLECKSLYFYRHPVPVSLSIIKRGWGNVSNAYLSNDIYRETYLNEEIYNFSMDILKNGTLISKFVLEWCLTNLVPIKYNKMPKYVLSYEELILHPVKAIEYLTDNFELNNKNDMLEKLNSPSKTALPETVKEIREKGNKYIATRWMERIDPNDYDDVLDILKIFELDIYDHRSGLLKSKYRNLA